MLPERVFVIGGLLAVVTGALLLADFALDPVPALWGALEAAVLLFGFGGFFLYVGKGAGRDRRRLLDTPRPPP